LFRFVDHRDAGLPSGRRLEEHGSERSEPPNDEERISTRDNKNSVLQQMKIIDREITHSDLEQVSEFLGKGIGYSDGYFLQLLQLMTEHPTPVGFPKYGRILTCDGTIVGAVILIFSTVQSEGAPAIRCHVTGWCVEPAYRGYAALFFAKDLRHPNVTYINISAQSTAGTLPIIATQGFVKYSSGQFVAVPALHFAPHDSQVKIVSADNIPNAPFESFDMGLLAAHAKYGCISLWCVTAERAYPFVFRPRLFKRVIPGVQLVYCRDVEDFRRFAGPIGRFLALRGRFVVRIDSNGPVEGLVGKFMQNADSRFYKGSAPRLGDLAYTHLAMCAYVPRKKKGSAKAF
jgi:hypothetical protein